MTDGVPFLRENLGDGSKTNTSMSGESMSYAVAIVYPFQNTLCHSLNQIKVRQITQVGGPSIKFEANASLAFRCVFFIAIVFVFFFH